MRLPVLLTHLFPLVLISLGSISWAGDQGTSAWTTFRNSMQNTGRSHVTLGEISAKYSNRKVWSFQTQGLIWSTPVIDANGNAYIGSTDRHFYALDPHGRLLWKYSLTDKPNAIIDSAAAVDADHVYIPGGDGRVHAINKWTGETNWTFQAYHAEGAGEHWVNSFEGNIAFGPGDRLYAPSDNGHLYALDRSGKEAWNYRTRGLQFLWSLPAFAADESWMVFGSLDKHLYLLDPNNGKELAVIDVGAEVKASPAIDTDGNIFIGTSDGRLLSLSVRMEDGRWAFHENFAFEVGKQIYASSAIYNGKIVFAAHDGFVYCLSSGGELQWKYYTGAGVSSSPLVSEDGIVIIGAGNGKVYALDVQTGKRLWSYFFPDRYFKVNIDASPTVSSDGRILVGCFNGLVYSLPFEYCLQNSDQRCDTDPGDDLPLFAMGLRGSTGVRLRNIGPSGRYIDRVDRKVRLNEVLHFRLVEIDENGSPVPNTAIAHSGLEINFEPEVDFAWQISANNEYLNIYPKRFWPAATDFTLSISGDYFHRTHPILDYFKFLFLPEYRFETNLRTVDVNPALQQKSIEDMIWEMKSIYVSQPAVIDTLSAADIDGQRFVLTVLHFDEKSREGIVLVNLGVNTSRGVIASLDPDKVVLWKVVNEGGFLRFSGSFHFMTMGSGAMMDDLVATAQLTDDDGLSEGHIIGSTSCFAMRSNRDIYVPSLNIIDELCDYKFEFHMVGGFDGERLERESQVTLTSIKRDKEEIHVQLSIDDNAEKRARLVTLVGIDTKTNQAEVLGSKIMETDKMWKTSFTTGNWAANSLFVVVLDEQLIFKGRFPE